jgi:hypothetical protein
MNQRRRPKSNSILRDLAVFRQPADSDAVSCRPDETSTIRTYSCVTPLPPAFAAGGTDHPQEHGFPQKLSLRKWHENQQNCKLIKSQMRAASVPTFWRKLKARHQQYAQKENMR